MAKNGFSNRQQAICRNISLLSICYALSVPFLPDSSVFSWQEIFNTAVGGGVMVVLERGGKPLDGDRGQLELISAEDYFTGSRYVRGLKDIEVVLVQ